MPTMAIGDSIVTVRSASARCWTSATSNKSPSFEGEVRVRRQREDITRDPRCRLKGTRQGVSRGKKGPSDGGNNNTAIGNGSDTTQRRPARTNIILSAVAFACRRACLFLSAASKVRLGVSVGRGRDAPSPRYCSWRIKDGTLPSGPPPASHATDAESVARPMFRRPKEAGGGPASGR